MKMKTEALKALFEEILTEYKETGRTKELWNKFREVMCLWPCAECPLDKQVGRYVVCDHLLHGDRATDWEEMEGGEGDWSEESK